MVRFLTTLSTHTIKKSMCFVENAKEQHDIRMVTKWCTLRPLLIHVMFSGLGHGSTTMCTAQRSLENYEITYFIRCIGIIMRIRNNARLFFSTLFHNRRIICAVTEACPVSSGPRPATALLRTAHARTVCHTVLSKEPSSCINSII